MYFLSACSDPKFHECTVESIKTVTHDTKLFTVRLPQASFLSVPTGHHVTIRANVNGRGLLVALCQCYICSINIVKWLTLPPPPRQMKLLSAATHLFSLSTVRDMCPVMGRHWSSWSNCTTTDKCHSTSQDFKLVSAVLWLHIDTSDTTGLLSRLLAPWSCMYTDRTPCSTYTVLDGKGLHLGNACGPRPSLRWR